MVAPSANALAHAGLARGVGRKRGRFGEQRATFTVQIAGQRVEYVHQPTGQRAVLLGAGADAGIDGGTGRTRQVTGQGADGVGSYAATRRYRLGREGRHGLLHLRYAVDPIGHSSQLD